MSKIDRYIRHDNYKRFVEKIFKRHDKNKDDLLDKEGENFFFSLIIFFFLEFTILMRNFKDPNLEEADINEIYLRMMGASESSDGIDFDAFFENSLFKSN